MKERDDVIEQLKDMDSLAQEHDSLLAIAHWGPEPPTEDDEPQYEPVFVRLILPEGENTITLSVSHGDGEVALVLLLKADDFYKHIGD